MHKGQVKWFDPKKGYGFIVGPNGHDVFVHYSHIQAEGFRALRDGEWVEYELVEGEKGYQARQVNQTDRQAGDEAPQLAAPPATPYRDAPDRTASSSAAGYERPEGGSGSV